MAKVLGFLQPCLSVWCRCWVALGGLRLLLGQSSWGWWALYQCQNYKFVPKYPQTLIEELGHFKGFHWSFFSLILTICRITEAEVLAPIDIARTKSSPYVLADFTVHLTQPWASWKEVRWQTDCTDCCLLWEGPCSQCLGHSLGRWIWMHKKVKHALSRE